MNNRFPVIKQVLISSLLLLFWTGCHTSKKIPETPAAPSLSHKVPDPASFLDQGLDYSSFSGKADLHINTGNLTQNLTANLRMHKDKDIWASVLALGILEAARAYITPDSLFALDRLSKTAYRFSYSEGAQLIQAEVPFSLLQNLIIGNPLIRDIPVNKVEVRDSVLLITQNKQEYTQVLTYHLHTRVLQHLSLRDKKRAFGCEIDYAQYKPLALKQPFSYSRDVFIEQDGKKLFLHMEFSKAETNVPLEMNFSIPASYKQGNLRGK